MNYVPNDDDNAAVEADETRLAEDDNANTSPPTRWETFRIAALRVIAVLGAFFFVSALLSLLISGRILIFKVF